MPTAFKENVKYLLTISFALTVFTLITFNLQNISGAKRVLGASTIASQNLEEEKIFWENFLEENPNYLDGWIELAVLEEEQGNGEKASGYYLRAKELDPNSEKLPW